MNLNRLLPTLFVILLAVFTQTDAEGDDNLPDLEFAQTKLENENIIIDKNDDTRTRTTKTFDEEASDEDESKVHQTYLTEREMKLRQVLLRALSNGKLRKKFAEVMPVLRTMNKSQRLTLTALIQAQVDGNQTLTLDKVKQLFGKEEELILPLIINIANLIKMTGSTTTPPNYSENELSPSIQTLRRSFFSTKPEIFSFYKPPSKRVSSDEDESESVVAKVTDITKLVPMHQRDDTLEVDEGTSIIKNITAHSRIQRFAEYPNEIKLAQSYHERKFNMTAFNSTEGQMDQEAMASDLLYSVTLPHNLTLDEVENLSLGSLDADGQPSFNETVEALPTPEHLVAKKRFRPVPIIKQAKLSNRKEAEDCEVFGGTLCLHVKNYPKEQIMRSIRRHKHAMNALLVDYSDKGERNDDYSDHIRRRQDDTQNTGQMCDSIIRYARPQKARSATGEWKYVVNTGGHTQTLRLEKCSSPEDSCSYLTDNYRSRCLQVYNYHRLLSWDQTRGLHVDIFKVPTCCSCHIDGYREAFPPLSEYDSYSPLDLDDGQLQSSSNHHPYIEEYDEDDSDDYYKYQVSGSKNKKRPGIKPNGSSHRNRYDKPFSPSPSLQPYLSPPIGEYDPILNFQRPGRRRRRPSQNAKRKQATVDQNASASDYVSNEVTVLPPFPVAEEEPSYVAAKLPNVDAKRVNYNYHPIIDFFDKEKAAQRKIVERIGSLNQRNSWRPMINRRG